MSVVKNMELDDRDFAALAPQLLRAIRGNRSQNQLNHRLKLRSNTVYRWEAGTRRVTWQNFVRFCDCCNVDVAKSMRSVLGTTVPPSLDAELLTDIIGEAEPEYVRKALALSQPQLQRLRNGTSRVSLERMLIAVAKFYNLTTLLLLLRDFVELERVPVLASRAAILEQQLQYRSKHPYSSVILALLDIVSRQTDDRKKKVKLLANKLGWPREEVESDLQPMIDIGMIDANLQLIATQFSALGDAKLGRKIRAFWALKSAEMISAVDDSQRDDFTSTWGVMTMTRADFMRVKELHFRFQQKVMAISKMSSAKNVGEEIVVVNSQIFKPLDLGMFKALKDLPTELDSDPKHR